MALFSLVLLGSFLPNLSEPNVLAAPSGVTQNIELLDSDTNGQIDTITFEIYNPDNDTWQLTGAAPHGLSVTMDGDDVDIDGVSITSAADANPVIVEIDLLDADPDLERYNTNGVTNDPIELIYTQQTGDQTCTICIQDGVAVEMNTIATGDTFDADTEQDAAAPVPYILSYYDTDDDARIDEIQLFFTEAAVESSVLSANDVVFTDVGDFTGAAFGTNTDDLINSGSTFITIPLGTEATAQDTNEPSLEVDFQNGFLLEDASGNTLSAPHTYDGLIQDYASPQILDFEYQDDDADGRIDEIAVTYSEAIGSNSVVTAGNFVFENGGDFLEVDFGSDTTDLAEGPALDMHVITLGTEAANIDTRDDSGQLEISIDSMVVRGLSALDEHTLDGAQTLATYSDGADVVVADTNPNANGTLRPLDKSITVTFSEEMDTTTIDELAEVDVSPDPGGVAFSTSTDGSGRTVLTIAHDEFADDATVTVTVDAAAEALDGSTIGSDYVLDFTAKERSSGGGGSTPLTYSVEVTSPNGAETLNAGDQTTITWQLTSNGTTSFVNIYVSYDNGATWNLVAENADNTGAFNWTVPTVETTEALVKVELSDLTTTPGDDTSNNTFNIISDATSSDAGQGDGNPEDQIMGISPVTGELEPINEIIAGDYIVGASFDTVYFITEDLTRRPFINEQLFFTWQEDFSNVKTVTDATLQALPLGSPMLSQPKVTLIKIMSVNDVYAVEAHPTDSARAIKRLIESEDLAAALYGDDWSDYVTDIEPTLFHYFDDGDPMTSSETIDLSIMQKRIGKN